MKRIYLSILFLVMVVAIKAQFNLSWAEAPSPSGNNSVYGNANCVDAAGNTYATGKFGGTVDFDPGTGVSNLSVLTPTSFGDAFVCKLNTLGNLVWARQLDGSLYTEAFAITTDASGNVYVSGQFWGTVDFDPGPGVYTVTSINSAASDLFILKLDASGSFLWARDFGGANGQIVAGERLATDATGNVYTTCIFEGTIDFDPAATVFTLTAPVNTNNLGVVKLNAAGNFVWAKNYNNNTLFWDDIKIDASGNAYLAGNYQGTVDFDAGPGVATLTSSGNSGDVFLLKLDATGNFVWAKSMGSPSLDYANGLAIDASANILVTGHFNGTCDFDPGPGVYTLTAIGSVDFFIVKLDASGSLLWAKDLWSGIPVSNSYPGIRACIATDVSGNVYTSGVFQGTVDLDPGPGTYYLSSAGHDIFINKLNAAGNFVWAGSLGGFNSNGYAEIGLDAASNLYAGGLFTSIIDLDPGPFTYTLQTPSVNAFFEKICQWPSQPTAVGGNSVACQGVAGVYSVAPVAGATSYSWSLPAGWQGSSSSSSIHITPISNGTASVSISFSGCAQATEIVSITVLPLPTVAIVSGSICSGQTYTLMAFGAGSYTVQGGQFVVSPAASTTYSVIGTGGNGCVSAPFTASVIVNPTPTITINSGSVCAGNTFILVPSGAATYSIAGGLSVVMPSVTTTYSVIGSSTAGCVSSANATVIVNASPLPTLQVAASGSGTLCLGESVTFSLSGAGTYAWNTGETTAVTVKSPTANAAYLVTGTDANGCWSTLSIAEAVVACTGLEQLSQNAAGIKFFPNPTSGKLTIELNAASGNARVEVYALTGQLLLTARLNETPALVDLYGLANGVYQLNIIQNEKTIRYAKLIKN